MGNYPINQKYGTQSNSKCTLNTQTYPKYPNVPKVPIANQLEERKKGTREINVFKTVLN